MTLFTVQTVCSTFLSHDGMILGNVGISPRPSSCLTRNNAQRRFGFDRISSIAQRCDLPVISPFDLLKVRESRQQIMVSQILPKKKEKKSRSKFSFFGRIEKVKKIVDLYCGYKSIGLKTGKSHICVSIFS